ncbi:MAG: DMT family transporter [Anaerovoracaceae bacterium]
MKKQLKADLMLIVVTLCWGISYYLMDVCLSDMGAFTLNAYRFIGAFVIAGVLMYPKLKTVNKITLKYSCLVGMALVFVYIGATFGVQYTTLSNSGFLCALTVVFTPMFGFIFFKRRPEKKLILVVTMCFVGIALLTLKDDFSINLANLKGDLLCIGGGMAYAIDLLLTEKAVSHEEVNPLQLGVFQLGVTGILNVVLAIFLEEPHLPSSSNVWMAVIFLSVFCTGVAFIVQAVAQKYTSASHVGVIFTLEPVFCSISAFFLVGEVLSPKSYLGAFIMLASIFIMEVDFKFLKKDHKNIDEKQIENIDDNDKLIL